MGSQSHGPGPEAGGDRLGSEPLAELSSNLRSLALRLVREDSTADDVVQEAWLAALDSKPDQVRDLNRWLRKVVVNLARRSHVRARRRAEIEALAAVSEELAGGQVEDVAGVRDLLVESVETLREPYRSVLRLRFFDEVDVAEIARRRGASPATVRSQLHRGLALMREHLDRTHDGRRADWIRALGPVALVGAPQQAVVEGDRTAGSDADPARGEAAPDAPPAAGVSSRSLALVAGAVTLAVAGGWWLLRDAPDTGLADAEPPAPAAEPRAEEALVASDPAPAPGDRSPLPVVAPNSAPPDDGTRLLEVLVKRLDGSPAIQGMVRITGPDGVELVNHDDVGGHWPADLDGRAVIPIPEEYLEGEPWFPADAPGVSLVVYDRDEAISPVCRTSVARTGATFTAYCAGPPQSVFVTVVDEEGLPISGARVVVHGNRLRGLRGHDMAAFTEIPRMAFTGADGRAELTGLVLQEHDLGVFAPGRPVRHFVVASDAPLVEQTVVVPPGISAYGQVTFADQRPAPFAQVWREAPEELLDFRAIATPKVTADEDGFFELPGLSPGSHHVFACAADDRGLFDSTVLVVEEDGEVVWEPVLRQVVPLRVRILDESGAPLRNASAQLTLRGSPLWVGGRRTNEDGIAAFLQVPKGTLDLALSRDTRAIDPISVPDVSPADGQREFRLGAATTAGSLRGRLLDALDAPANATVVLARDLFLSFDSLAQPGVGTFGLPGIPPGTYTLAARAPGLGQYVFGPHTVEPNTPVDLGIVRLPEPATLQLEWKRSGPTPDRPWHVFADLEGVTTPFRARTLLAPEATLTLLPGHYRLGTFERTFLEFDVPPAGGGPLLVD